MLRNSLRLLIWRFRMYFRRCLTTLTGQKPCRRSPNNRHRKLLNSHKRDKNLLLVQSKLNKLFKILCIILTLLASWHNTKKPWGALRWNQQILNMKCSEYENIFRSWLRFYTCTVHNIISPFTILSLTVLSSVATLCP